MIMPTWSRQQGRMSISIANSARRLADRPAKRGECATITGADTKRRPQTGAPGVAGLIGDQQL